MISNAWSTYDYSCRRKKELNFALKNPPSWFGFYRNRFLRHITYKKPLPHPTLLYLDSLTLYHPFIHPAASPRLYRSVLGHRCWKSSENMRQNRLCDDVFRFRTPTSHPSHRCVMQPLNFYSIHIQKFPSHTLLDCRFAPHQKNHPTKCFFCIWNYSRVLFC
jgi:hypothetical protein